ncbi:hypothetical protein F0L68_39160 [Solihabitans fulvus]|uniref:Uncharacterized protein n=1 Tax=Solihabitans fulvus TaxID=1892852 RepID=A0A5B2WFP9_9PSEU|nr:hypothetical protein [Solihabitans fulvus]KAA2250165.1 hypothetical protein F0L68_39160 [Solihabitans fulvus]
MGTGTDSVTGRPYAMAASEPGAERGWGLLLVDLAAAARRLIEVPHPNSDLDTEQLGVQLYRRSAGSLLLLSGTHRRVDDGAGDVAHQEDSLFHSAAVEFAGRGLPQLQLHGFDDQSMPDTDVVLSPGAGEVGPAARRVGDTLEVAGLVTCRTWTGRCGQLEGTRNVQGQVAAEHGWVFLHLEVSRTVRKDPTRRQIFADAVAGADVSAHGDQPAAV